MPPHPCIPVISRANRGGIPFHACLLGIVTNITCIMARFGLNCPLRLRISYPTLPMDCGNSSIICYEPPYGLTKRKTFSLPLCAVTTQPKKGTSPLLHEFPSGAVTQRPPLLLTPPGRPSRYATKCLERRGINHAHPIVEPDSSSQGLWGVRCSFAHSLIGIL
ncbi:hypothetical protein LX32DRAFT_76072 [Colletotrichum zoysiae]|uniref:Uncharacterized protein n=1 Tax=Colletotrichum zoysiae TaxID=1216348 RepID=A0AAD9HA13_9PEZI|nr:hypothetical protein LX32DRAFT_76072 [Colletotrichum zoysiae]